MAKMHETIFRITGEVAGSLMTSLSNANRAIQRLKQTASGGVKAAIDVQPGKLNNALKMLQRQQAALERYKQLQREGFGDRGVAAHIRELQQAAEALRRAGISLNNLKGAENTLQRMRSEIERAQQIQSRWRDVQAANRRQNEARSNFESARSEFTSAVDTAKTVMSPLISSAQTAITYEAELSRSKALTQMDNLSKGLTDVVEREMAMLDARYQEIGRTTKFSATQAARAGNYLAMAGWQSDKIDAGLPSVVNLAIASGSGVESAADILSNIQTAFGIGTSAEEIQHLSDVITTTVTHSNQNLYQFGEAMKYAAPVAKMFGSSVEETATLTKFMADAGIQGSMAGTSLRATMLRLVAPPKKASKAMEENGITVDDATKAWVNANEIAAEYGITLDETADGAQQMASIIEQINTKMAGMSPHEMMAAFSAITGITAVSGAMNIFTQDVSKIKEFTKQLRESSNVGGGAAAQTAGVMNDNTAGSLISLESAKESLEIAIGRSFSPAIRRAVDTLTEMTRSATELAAANPGLVQAFGALTGAIGATIVGLAAFRVGLAGIEFAKTTIGMMKSTSAFQAMTGAGGLLSRAEGFIGSLGGGAGRRHFNLKWGRDRRNEGRLRANNDHQAPCDS